MPSLSRPGVSNDNPYSESRSKSACLLAQGIRYPVRRARTWVDALVRWYNEEHRHSANRFVTPAQCHANLDHDILDRRAALYETARQRNPLRWKGRTRNWQRLDADLKLVTVIARYVAVAVAAHYITSAAPTKSSASLPSPPDGARQVEAVSAPCASELHARFVTAPTRPPQAT